MESWSSTDDNTYFENYPNSHLFWVILGWSCVSSALLRLFVVSSSLRLFVVSSSLRLFHPPSTLRRLSHIHLLFIFAIINDFFIHNKKFGSMLTAERFVDQTSGQQRAQLKYFLSSGNGLAVTVDEDTGQVDGIGGTTWEGALVLAKVMESLAANADNANDVSHCHVLELGCGTGLVGLVAHHVGFRTTITDRVVDLAASNVQRNISANNDMVLSRKRRVFSRDNTSLIKNAKYRTQEIMHSVDPDYNIEENLSISLHVDEDRSCDFEEPITVLSLPWGNNIFQQFQQKETFTASSRGESSSSNTMSYLEQQRVKFDEIWNVHRLCRERGGVDIVIGAEITCLKKQHALLVETVVDVVKANPKAIFLFTFDGLYNPDTPASNYEKEFIDRMKAHKFRYSLISDAEVHWKSENSLHRRAAVFQHGNSIRNQHLSFPRPACVSHIDSISMQVDEEEARDFEDDKNNIFHHHVLAFYLSEAIQTCQRCHREFCSQSNCRAPSRSGNIFNSLLQARSMEEGCHFHSGIFVCRRHPAETRCSINGVGDQLGYYGNGKEGWKAEFWDCCGSEDPNCSGCCFDRHIPY